MLPNYLPVILPFRCLGARIGSWVRIQHETHAQTVPDGLDLGDYSHLGDNANMSVATPLNAREMLVAPTSIKANVSQSTRVKRLRETW